jgi:hypothetical protein
MPPCPQDWMFYNTRGLELTLELHVVKDPPPQQLPAMWADNQLPLMRYMEMVRAERARVRHAALGPLLLARPLLLLARWGLQHLHKLPLMLPLLLLCRSGWALTPGWWTPAPIAPSAPASPLQSPPGGATPCPA